MKKFIIQAVLLLLVIGVAMFLYSSGNQQINLSFLPQPSRVATLEINGTRIKVELADTETKRSKGLGGRQSLAELEGMLFIFPKEDRYPFWMKGMNFALDFIWIRGDKIVEILPNVQPPLIGQTDSSLPIYSSSVAIDKVLEVNAGTVQKLNIKVEDMVKLQNP